MKNIKTILLPVLSIFAFFLSGTSFSQEKFLPGYVVMLNGDTIRGFIDYRNWDRNPDNVGFRENENSKKWSYSPRLIKAFGVVDENYESAVIDVETSPFQTQDLSHDPAVMLQKDSIFLQAVVKGAKSLYYYKMRSGREQFYIKKDEAFDLLIYKQYLKDDVNRTVIVENKTYAGQLTLYLAECTSIAEKVNQTTYRKNSLEALFLNYYKCMNTSASFQKKTEKTKAEFGVLAGVSMTSLKFTGSAYPYLTKADFGLSVNVSAGAFLEIILPRAQRKWSVNNELIISTFRTDATVEYHDAYNVVVSTTIGLTYLKLNNMVRFKLPVGKFYPYLNLGISNGLAFLETNQAHQSSSNVLYDNKDAKALQETRKWEFGLLGGLGLMYKDFSFEARYEYGNGMSPYIALKSITGRIYLFLGYRF